MKLYVIQCEAVGIHQDIFFVFIDKNADTLCVDRQVIGQFA